MSPSEGGTESASGDPVTRSRLIAGRKLLALLRDPACLAPPSLTSITRKAPCSGLYQPATMDASTGTPNRKSLPLPSIPYHHGRAHASCNDASSKGCLESLVQCKDANDGRACWRGHGVRYGRRRSAQAGMVAFRGVRVPSGPRYGFGGGAERVGCVYPITTGARPIWVNVTSYLW
jgi:hypothetical protein